MLSGTASQTTTLPTFVLPVASPAVLPPAHSGTGTQPTPLPTFAVPAASPAVIPPARSGAMAQPTPLPSSVLPVPRPTVMPSESVPLQSASSPGAVRMMDPSEVEIDVPEKIRARILQLEYVEMNELLPESWQFENLATQCCPHHLQARTTRKRAITDIALWTECYAALVAILSTRYPQYTPEFMGYQRVIVRAARNFEGAAWVTYDMCYRRKAARCKDLHWSRIDSALYHDAFTGRTRSVPRCTFCLSPHHSSQQCLFAPVGLAQEAPPPSFGVSLPSPAPRVGTASGQLCGLKLAAINAAIGIAVTPTTVASA